MSLLFDYLLKHLSPFSRQSALWKEKKRVAQDSQSLKTSYCFLCKQEDWNRKLLKRCSDNHDCLVSPDAPREKKHEGNIFNRRETEKKESAASVSLRFYSEKGKKAKIDSNLTIFFV